MAKYDVARTVMRRAVVGALAALVMVPMSACEEFNRGLAGGAAGAYQSRQHPVAQSGAPAQVTAGPTSLGSHSAPPGAKFCSSDYGCGYGSQCVKQQLQSTGYCAQVVNEYGLPTYAAPRSDSFGPGNPIQCSFNVDCGVGWRCDKGTGIAGTCVR